MTIIASGIKYMLDFTPPAYYEESPYKPTLSGSTTFPAIINAIASAFKELLGDENVITGMYDKKSNASYVGYSMIANCGNFRIIIGHLTSYYSGVPFRIGITYDNPTYTEYCGDNSGSFGDHINHVTKNYTGSGSSQWTTGFQCQLIQDTETNTFYLLFNDSSTGGSTSKRCYALGSFGVNDNIFLLTLTNSSTDNSAANPDSGSTYAGNCASLENNNDEIIHHTSNLFSPLFLFDRATSKAGLSGTSSTAKKYVSGVMIWETNVTADASESQKLFAVIPPSKLGRISTTTEIPRGTMFNNFKNVVAIDNVLIPWTGDPEQSFIV